MQTLPILRLCHDFHLLCPIFTTWIVQNAPGPQRLDSLFARRDVAKMDGGPMSSLEGLRGLPGGNGFVR